MSTTLLGLAHGLPPARSIGGAQRPIAVEPGGASDLALAPAQAALARSGMAAADIDFVVFATQTGDVTFPGSACFFQDKLGCGTTGALDVRGQCAGFLMGLMVADTFIQAGAYQRVLLAAAEVYSSGLDYSERGMAMAQRFGDGAAVAILGPGEGGLEAVVCHSDGQHYDQFWCEHPASRQHPVRMTIEDFHAGKHFPNMDAAVVEAFGREHLPAVVREVLGKAGVGADAVDCFILSHVLPQVAAAAGEALGLPAAKVLVAGARDGHLGAAALPAALSEAIEAGRVGKGARVCLAACGAGFAWGAAVLAL